MFLMDLSSIMITSLGKKDLVTFHFFGLFHVYYLVLFALSLCVISRPSLRKHAYSNKLEILPPKTDFSDKSFLFLIFLLHINCG